ncbi:hypothetical protein BV898_00514 [Hypsibius exemplaris]|uniref:L-Fucosyltransferase n=1 Tax=Hypsibius exemplaris TaxID=2072580 RepID=A0A1W0XDL7_HYPEX|nr:hypothetical protein BV898_00514 [Hypsibius exemplaris]
MKGNTEYATIPLLSDESDDEELDRIFSPARVMGKNNQKVHKSRQGSKLVISTNQSKLRLNEQQTTINMDADSVIPSSGSFNVRSADEKHCFQYNWIVVLLLSTLLSWFSWSAFKQISQGYNIAHHHGSSKFNVTGQCFWTSNFDGSWAFGNRTIWLANMTSQFEVLSQFNDKNDKERVIDIEGCSAKELIGLTIARLRMRFEDRQLKRSSHMFPEGHRAGPFIAHPELARKGFGLGNFMFILATGHGLAAANNRTFVLLNEHEHERPFLDLRTQHRESLELFGVEDPHSANKAIVHAEKAFGKYDPSLESFARTSGKENILIDGYLQVHQVFEPYREEIRSMFVLKKSVTEEAIKVLKAGMDIFSRTEFASKLKILPRLVGVHVRRGDITTGKNLEFGHKPASDEYLLRTVLHMQTQHEPVVFVVISNDIAYCRNLFSDENFIFMDLHELAEVDMAILTVMDYLVLSVGTFGWWGAYLSDAREVYYYRDWPRSGSPMEKGINHKDYFLSSWIPKV